MTAWDARSAELLTKLACVSAVAAGLALVPAVASSDIFVIPLPGVAGLYGVGPAPAAGQRSTTFHLPGTPGVIRGASFHAVGTTVVGTLICDDGPTPTQSPYPASLTVEMLDAATNNGWDSEAHMPTLSGALDSTAPFTTFGYPGHPGASWAFLAGGAGSITVYGGPGPALLGCSPSGPLPTVTITQAWLLLDADIPVAAHGASWGAVKAIYR